MLSLVARIELELMVLPFAKVVQRFLLPDTGGDFWCSATLASFKHLGSNSLCDSLLGLGYISDSKLWCKWLTFV